MVNKELFSKRLVDLLNFYDISASTLADKIGVQRSSISHLISGRNNPSLDFILRVLDNYKEITFDWFVKGIGELSSDSFKNDTPTLFEQASQNLDIHKEKKNKTVEANLSATQKDFKSIEKIILLYNDGSFEFYKP